VRSCGPEGQFEDTLSEWLRAAERRYKRMRLGLLDANGRLA
jgi:hypothetical protein